MRRTFWIMMSLLAVALALRAPSADARRLPADAELQDAARSIREITLERTYCFGKCPVDEVTLRRDGTATYVGYRFVDRIGTYVGHVDARIFEWLAESAVELGYLELQDRYIFPATDLPSRITTVVSDDRRKRVVNYGHAGPASLATFEDLIGAAAATVWDWQRVE